MYSLKINELFSNFTPNKAKLQFYWLRLERFSSAQLASQSKKEIKLTKAMNWDILLMEEVQLLFCFLKRWLWNLIRTWMNGVKMDLKLSSKSVMALLQSRRKVTQTNSLFF